MKNDVVIFGELDRLINGKNIPEDEYKVLKTLPETIKRLKVLRALAAQGKVLADKNVFKLQIDALYFLTDEQKKEIKKMIDKSFKAPEEFFKE